MSHLLRRILPMLLGTPCMLQIMRCKCIHGFTMWLFPRQRPHQPHASACHVKNTWEKSQTYKHTAVPQACNCITDTWCAIGKFFSMLLLVFSFLVMPDAPNSTCTNLVNASKLSSMSHALFIWSALYGTCNDAVQKQARAGNWARILTEMRRWASVQFAKGSPDKDTPGVCSNFTPSSLKSGPAVGWARTNRTLELLFLARTP